MLLIDSDFLAYKAAQACEIGIDFGEDVIIAQSQFSEVLRVFHNELNKVTKAMMEDDFILYFSSTENFRKKIYPDYKGHRNRKKPCGYRRVITELTKSYEVIRLPELEADDAMGIYATAHEGNVICSPDKDMRQIPGRLFDMKELTMIDPVEGAKWHLIQTLAGDQTDGYSGVPGIGIKRAVTLFEEDGYTWQTVVKAFEAKDLTEDDALMNARLARILTCNDYDPIQHTVIPWTPAADYRADS